MIESLISFLTHLRRSRYYISQDASGNCIQGGCIIQSDNITLHGYCICSFGYFPGVKYPKEHTQYSNHGESLKSITLHDLQICNDSRCCYRHNVLASVIRYTAIIPGPCVASVSAPVPRLAVYTCLGSPITHSTMKCTHRTFWGAEPDRVLTAKID